MTTHWPHKATLFPTTPRTWGKPLPNINPIVHSEIKELGYRLIGYETKPNV